MKYNLHFRKIYNDTMRASILVMCVASFTACKPEKQNPCKEFDKIDLEMLQIIDEINSRYAEDRKFIAAFKDAQIYWIQYRNRHIKAIYPLEPKKYDFDVGKCKCEVYSTLTLKRIEELKQWVDGVPEAAGCEGTFNSF